MTEASPGAGAKSRARSAEEGVEISQTIEVDANGVKRMIADRYAPFVGPIDASYVSFQVHDASLGGMSSSLERMGETTVHLPDEAKASAAGLPSRIVLKREAVAAIVAGRLGEALGREIHPSRISFDVSGSSGTGYSRSGPHLNCARLRFTIQG